MKKTRYAKMPPPKTEKGLRLRIITLETENAYLKKCVTFRRQIKLSLPFLFKRVHYLEVKTLPQKLSLRSHLMVMSIFSNCLISYPLVLIASLSSLKEEIVYFQH